MEMMYEMLLNQGAIGLLAMYAIYSNSLSQKKIEELLEKKEIKEEKIRERWISVVERLQQENDEMEKEIVRKLEDIERLLNEK